MSETTRTRLAAAGNETIGVAADQAFDTQRLVRRLRRWAPLVLVLTIIGAGAGLGLAKEMQKQYKATGSVLVLSAPRAGVSSYNLQTDQVTTTYASLMAEPAVYQQVIDSLHLHDTIASLGARVTVRPQTQSELIDVSTLDPDPKRAAAITNAVMATFSAQYAAQVQKDTATAGSALSDQLNSLEQTLANDQAALQKTKATPAGDVTGAQQRVNTDQALLTQLATNYSAFQAQQAQVNDSVRIASRAEVPTSPDSPKTTVNTLLGGAAGLVVGIALAMLLQFFDQGLRNEEDVEDRLGIDLLGRIPAYSPGGSRGRRADLRVAGEAYRRLRTNLQFASLDAPLGVVVVTSASAREGKTLTTSNLASVLAASGKRTLIVDADLRRPRLHTVFQKPLHGGLSEMLLRARETHRIDLEHFVKRTGQANLWVLTAGVIPPNPAEMLSSAYVEQALEAMTAVYDVVIIDTPPLGAVADAAILAARASGAVVVLEAGKTGARQARAAVSALARSGVRVYGAVLNKAQGAGEGYGSYDKYYYTSHLDSETTGDSSDDVSVEALEVRRERSWAPIVEAAGA